MVHRTNQLEAGAPAHLVAKPSCNTDYTRRFYAAGFIIGNIWLLDIGAVLFQLIRTVKRDFITQKINSSNPESLSCVSNR